MYYLVSEYYLNGETPHEIDSYVKATSPMEAIRSKPFWKYAIRYTRISGEVNKDKQDKIEKDWEDNAHTQDGDGKNGCRAKRVSNQEYRDRLRTTKNGAFEFGHVSTPDQMVGSMEPFSPHWWCQYMGNGAGFHAGTYREILQWMREY
mgnify:CR=1 FL=1